MSETLKHPLLLLLVGAALTGFVVPAITYLWQVQQRELDIKIGLVSEISETVMKILMAIQFVHVAARRYPDDSDELSGLRHQLNQSYHDWEVSSAIIGTKLLAYVPDPSVSQKWSEFSLVITDFYAQEGMTKEQIHTFAVGISERLSQLLEQEAVGREWEKQRDAILKLKSQTIESILGSHKLKIRTRWPFSISKT